MDKPSTQTQVHLSTNYSRVIKDIENLEQFYDAKVLAIRSTTMSEKRSVSFGSTLTLPKQERKIVNTMYGDSSESEGSYLCHDRPDTPEPETPWQAKLRLRGMWGQNPR